MGKLSNKEIDRLMDAEYEALGIKGHDAIVQAVLEERDKASKEAVVASFVASLPTRDLHRRAALGPYAVARVLKVHPFEKYSGGGCVYCGGYRNGEIVPKHLAISNTLRYGLGGLGLVRLESIFGLLYHYNRDEVSEGEERPEEGYPVLRKFLEVAASLPPQGRHSDLVKLTKTLLPSNIEERRAVIETLAVCGILQPEGHPSWFDRFITSREQDERAVPHHWNSWLYPVDWWRGKDGVNGEAVRFWFPELGWED